MHTLVSHSQANAEANALEERLTGVEGGEGIAGQARWRRANRVGNSKRRLASLSRACWGFFKACAHNLPLSLAYISVL